ncbi:MAG: PD-(D/E)XK nuclease family protein [Acidimicrobiales bacterium]
MRGVGVLEVLRGDPHARPAPEPALVEAARAHLEAAAVAGAAAVPEGVVVRVTKAAVAGVRRCEVRHLAELAHQEGAGGQPEPPAVVRGRLVDALFRQVATTGQVGGDPLADGLAGCAAEGEEAGTALAALSGAEQEQVRAEVWAASATLVASWPVLPAGAGLRTQERVLVALAGGRVLLSGRPDLAVGRPTRQRAGVLVVEAKSGRFRPEHLEELRFYVLLEALRWGVAPFRAVVWSLGDGRLEALDVDADLVWSETLRVADAITRLTRLAAGGAPRASANPLCPSCPWLDGCPDGARQVALAGGVSGCGEIEREDEDEDDEDGTGGGGFDGRVR